MATFPAQEVSDRAIQKLVRKLVFANANQDEQAFKQAKDLGRAVYMSNMMDAGTLLQVSGLLAPEAQAHAVVSVGSGVTLGVECVAKGLPPLAPSAGGAGAGVCMYGMYIWMYTLEVACLNHVYARA